MKNTCLVLLAILLFTSCSSKPVIKEKLGDDAIGLLTMTCSDPYEFTQDCSIFGGTKRKITIDGFDIKIAGSAKGDIVFVMEGNGLASAIKDGLTLQLVKDFSSEAVQNSYEAVKNALLDNGIAIRRVRPVVSSRGIEGYIFELDSDGYTLLKGFRTV